MSKRILTSAFYCVMFYYAFLNKDVTNMLFYMFTFQVISYIVGDRESKK